MPAIRCVQCGLIRWTPDDIEGSPDPIAFPECGHMLHVPPATSSPCYRTVRLRQFRLPGREPYSLGWDRLAAALFDRVDAPHSMVHNGSYSFCPESNSGFTVAKIVIYEGSRGSRVQGLSDGVYLWLRVNGPNVSSDGRPVVERVWEADFQQRLPSIFSQVTLGQSNTARPRPIGLSPPPPTIAVIPHCYERFAYLRVRFRGTAANIEQLPEGSLQQTAELIEDLNDICELIRTCSTF